MRALVAHNFYRVAGGEDVVFRNEVRLLRDAGVEVVTFERDNDALRDDLRGRVRAALDAAWSPATYAALRRLLREARPDVAHFHNTFPQISVSAYQACRDEGVPVVQTLHNFRVACLNGVLLREGHPCEDCVGRTPWRGVARGCYRGSRLASAAMAYATVSSRLRRSHLSGVDRFVALTAFARSRFVAAGLPPARIVVRPNVVADPPPPGDGAGGYVLFAGRLAEEKGVRTLVEAWASLRDVPLRVIGEGPLRPELEARAAAAGARVEFLGRVSHGEVARHLQGAALVVVPSIWYENMPMVVLEAYAAGAPVVASALGSLEELVPEPAHGLRFRAGDPAALARTVRRALSDGAWLARTRAANRALFLERYSPAAGTASLLALYRAVIGGAPRGTAPA